MKYSPDEGGGPACASRGVSDRRFALKRATDKAHARVEGIVQSAGMFDSMDGYRRYVSATWEMRWRFESLLDMSRAAEIWPAWPGRRIASLAALDLADLGHALPKMAAPLSEFHLSPSELLGVMYVMEGSSLGARVLVRLVGSLGLSGHHGARHLHAQAADAGAWRSFLGVLDSSPQPPCHDTARSVFDTFADAYEQARA